MAQVPADDLPSAVRALDVVIVWCERSGADLAAVEAVEGARAA